MKSQSGQGRVAFVLTAIVLVLLIGVSSYVVLGENGILSRRDAELVIETNTTAEVSK